MKKREAINYVLNTATALVLVSLVLFHRYFLLLDVFIMWWLREQARTPSKACAARHIPSEPDLRRPSLSTTLGCARDCRIVRIQWASA